MADYKELLETLPEHCREGILNYIEKGVSPGSFLVSVLSNNLRDSFGAADMINKPYIENYVIYLYNSAPINCWGSEEAVAAWIKQGGLEGKDD